MTDPAKPPTALEPDALDISARKRDHIELCSGDEVNFRKKGTLFDEVELVHCALPELHFDDIDTRVELLGKTLRAPVVISAMTGGTDEAAAINRELGIVAQELGLAIGLGSQRAMFERPDTAWTFEVRKDAPDVLLLGNLGIVQAREMSDDQIQELAGSVDADALCIHLNPAMELVQPGGDRDFRGGLERLGQLVEVMDIPIVAKETGCGLSRKVGQALVDVGIRHVDVSGAGGTSWVAVEAHRSVGQARQLAEELWDWGIPTAASVLQLRGLGLDIIATGGMRRGTDVVKALALGAKAGGLAAPVLKAFRAGGREGAKDFLEGVVHAVRTMMLLTGCKNVAQMQQAPTLLGPRLRAWRDQ